MSGGDMERVCLVVDGDMESVDFVLSCVVQVKQ